MMDWEFDAVMADSGLKFSVIALRALREEMAEVSKADMEMGLRAIFTNTARNHKPTSNEVVAAVRSAKQRAIHAPDIHDSQMADNPTADASKACIRALLGASTSRDRAKILCDYCDMLKEKGRLTANLEADAEKMINYMLTEHEAGSMVQVLTKGA